MSKKPIIVFEGIEGSGKSYHLNFVARYLKQKKIKIQAMQREKIEAQKRFKQQEELAIKAKALELREEEKLGRERKIE